MEHKPNLILIPKTVAQTHESQIQPSYCGVIPVVGEGRKRIRSARQGGCSKFKPSLIYRASLGPAKEPRTLFQ